MAGKAQQEQMAARATGVKADAKPATTGKPKAKPTAVKLSQVKLLAGSKVHAAAPDSTSPLCWPGHVLPGAKDAGTMAVNPDLVAKFQAMDKACRWCASSLRLMLGS